MKASKTISRHSLGLYSHALVLRCPMCNGAGMRLKRLHGVPHERYTRRCRRCGVKWDIEVTLISYEHGRYVERVDWQDEASALRERA